MIFGGSFRGRGHVVGDGDGGGPRQTKADFFDWKIDWKKGIVIRRERDLLLALSVSRQNYYAQITKTLTTKTSTHEAGS
jgi:hypothetical protein